MKRKVFITLISLIFALNACFKTEYSKQRSDFTLTLSYFHGTDLTPKAYPNIYVVWIENSQLSYIQNISICKKLIQGDLKGIALPYWKLNKFPLSDRDEIDTVTGATKANRDFTLTFTPREPGLTKFIIYLEVDRSFDSNDWFKDQPALLYSSEIDLQSSAKEYELKPCGWTPDKDIIINSKIFTSGTLQRELKYITNKKDGVGFGDIDNNTSATDMVKKIIVKVSRQD